MGERLIDKFLQSDLLRGANQEISVAHDEVIIKGIFETLAQVFNQMQMSTCNQVPSSIYVWCARGD